MAEGIQGVGRLGGLVENGHTLECGVDQGSAEATQTRFIMAYLGLRSLWTLKR